MEASGQDTVLTQSSKRIMLSSIVILVAACAMVALFHMYSKWCNTRVIHQSTRHPYATATAEAALASKGLEPAVVNALPSFVYESKSRESTLECAVCLSEFEDGEKGRLLPECKHSFHVDCIDLWFQSHSDCPLCRARVKAEDVDDDPVHLSEDPNEVVISILPMERDDPNQGHGSGSGSELECSTTSLMPEVVPWRSQMGENPYRGVDVSGSDIESGQKTTIGSVKVSKSKEVVKYLMPN